MRTYKFKLYSSKRSKRLHRKISIAGLIYNHLIALHRRHYRLFGSHIPVYKMHTHITKLKRLSKNEFWKEVGSQSIQDIADRIDRSYVLFFRNLKRGIKTSPPRFRKVRDYASITFKQAGYKFDDSNRVIVMGKEYKYSKSRDIEGKIKIVTLKRNSLGELYLYVVTDKEQEDNITARSGNIVGFDFGLKMFLTGSDETDIESPEYLHKDIKKIRRFSRQLSKKRKGSNNRKKARQELFRRHRKISDRRMDFHHKTAKGIACNYDIICVEDLSLKGMQKLWGRKISDLGHGKFLSILQHHCNKRGKQLVVIDRFYPSSKTCSACGFVLHELPLATRTWICPECSVAHDRDRNAARNIQRVGASTLSGEDVSSGLPDSLC